MEESSLADFYAGKGAPAVKHRSTPVRLLTNAAHLYRLRVREQPMQELLALLGIAAGVALLFAVQVASTSITGAVRQLAHGITGAATLEVAARGSDGMDQALVAKAQSLPSVKVAAPLVQQRINVVGPKGSAPLTLVGVDERLAKSGGPIVRKFTSERQDLDAVGLFLTEPTAKAIGAAPGLRITVESGATKYELPLAGTLGQNEIGGLEKSPVAMAPLGLAQRMSAMQGSVSRILIEPRPGKEQEATKELRAIARDKLDVRASDSEANLLAQALKPDQQSSALFSAIAIVIGMLFAYNAMLLAMSRRRRSVAYLRMIGADRGTILALLGFEAIALGLCASLLGVILGDLISRVVFQSVPQYLASGFPIGSQRVAGAQVVAVSFLGGLVAALLASAKPAIDLYRVTPQEAAKGGQPGGVRIDPSKPATLRLGLTMLVAASVLAFAAPRAMPLAIAGLIIGFVLVLGPLLSRALTLVKQFTRVHGGVGCSLAVDELAGNTARSTALVGIAVGAMLALVSIGGAQLDIKRGVDQLSDEFLGTADVWVIPGDRSNFFITQSFDPSASITRIEQRTDIRDLGVFSGSFLDVGERRLLVMARPSTDPRPLAPSQVVRGDIKQATERMRDGGWIGLSSAVANELGRPNIGDRVTIPTPSGKERFRVAAITTNHGWPPGVVVMNTRDFGNAWQSKAGSALMLRLAPGTTPQAGKKQVEDALGADSALRVVTSDEMIDERAESLAQGLARIRQISTMVLIAAVLAIVAAMFAAVWQRRPRLAALRALGMYRGELFRTLLAETTIVVLVGGIAGLVGGLYCQILASRWTELESGFRTVFEPAVGFGLVTLVEVTLLASLATALPAFLISRVAPSASEST